MVFLVKELLLNSIATPLYLYFAVFVVPRRVANAKLLFIFGTAGNRLLFVTVLGIRKSKKIQMMLRFFVLFPYDVTQLSLLLRFFHLSKVSASKKFIIMDCSGLTDSVFFLHSLVYKFLSGFFSCKSAHLSLVTVVNV